MDAFIGEIRAFAFTFAPVGWIQCSGQTLPVRQYNALFAVIGAYYGGDGRTEFKLPDLSGRATMGQGAAPGLSNYAVGEQSGVESYPLDQSEMPRHDHLVHGKVLAGAATGLTAIPSPTTYLSRLTNTAGAPAAGFTKPPLAQSTILAPGAIGITGSGMPHENRQPLLPMIFCICLEGEYPVRG